MKPPLGGWRLRRGAALTEVRAHVRSVGRRSSISEAIFYSFFFWTYFTFRLYWRSALGSPSPAAALPLPSAGSQISERWPKSTREEAEKRPSSFAAADVSPDLVSEQNLLI